MMHDFSWEDRIEDEWTAWDTIVVVFLVAVMLVTCPFVAAYRLAMHIIGRD